MRPKQAQFTLNGVTYTLDKNEDATGNNIHSESRQGATMNAKIKRSVQHRVAAGRQRAAAAAIAHSVRVQNAQAATALDLIV